MTTWFETNDIVPDVGYIVFIITPDGNIDVCEFTGHFYISVATLATKYKSEDIGRWASREQMVKMLTEGGYLD